ADGKPTLDKAGFASVKAGYDDQGNRISAAFFDRDGKPCLHTDGYARWTARYDEHGNRVEQSFFGIDGRPVMLRDGYATVRWSYDEENRMIDVPSSDATGKLVNQGERLPPPFEEADPP